MNLMTYFMVVIGGSKNRERRVTGVYVRSRASPITSSTKVLVHKPVLSPTAFCTSESYHGFVLAPTD